MVGGAFGLLRQLLSSLSLRLEIDQNQELDKNHRNTSLHVTSDQLCIKINTIKEEKSRIQLPLNTLLSFVAQMNAQS